MDILEQVAEIRAMEARHTMVKKLITETDFSVEKIASLADVAVDVVKKIKKSIRK